MGELADPGIAATGDAPAAFQHEATKSTKDTKKKR